MLRKLVAEGLLSVMLAAALFSLFRLPVEAETVYREITGMEELTDGRYVLITPQDIAPGTLAEEEGVISAVALPAVGDTVTDTAGGEWDLTVTENGVILTDAHGVSVSPVAPAEDEDGVNGITAGTYEWEVSWEDGYFSFRGFSGEEPVTLVSDPDLENGFCAHPDAEIAEAEGYYLGIFTLYRCTEVQDDEPGQDNPGQDAPGQDNPGQDNHGQNNPGQDKPGQDDPKPEEPKPGEAVKTSPKVIVSPEGGEI